MYSLSTLINNKKYWGQAGIVLGLVDKQRLLQIMGTGRLGDDQQMINTTRNANLVPTVQNPTLKDGPRPTLVDECYRAAQQTRGSRPWTITLLIWETKILLQETKGTKNSKIWKQFPYLILIKSQDMWGDGDSCLNLLPQILRESF